MGGVGWGEGEGAQVTSGLVLRWAEAGQERDRLDEEDGKREEEVYQRRKAKKEQGGRRRLTMYP